MSTESSPPALSASATGSRPAAAKPPRVLACVQCNSRKVRCNREFPCSNCIKSGAQCVPASLAPRQRRRRFPERELLDRLRRCEDLLRQNHIAFEPLHSHPASTANKSSPSDDHDSPEGQANDRDAGGREPNYKPKNFWRLMNAMSLNPESGDGYDGADDDSEDEADEFSPNEMRRTLVKKAWDQVYGSNERNILLGQRNPSIQISALHPGQVQIFKLWQIYLDNVNPLLKVTHTPTLQPRIIDAAGDVTKVSPELQALMFSIYSMSIVSLDNDECVALFGSSSKDLLRSYQFACSHALLDCDVLRTSDRDCLTALVLYLISVKTDTDPRVLGSTLGLAVRIAQRMGIQNEASYSKLSILEAEMCRRLWWALVVFDNRICEMCDHKSTTLLPTWDCKPPLNVNDFDLLPEMKSPPEALEKPSEAVFAVVRAELAEYVRHSHSHLDFTNPALKAIARGTELAVAEKSVEERYLQYCSPENPLHFMTIWTTRGYLAKLRLLDHYSKHSAVQHTDTERDAAVLYTLNMLECDSRIINSPLAKGFHWHARTYFPFPAYIHIVQDLKRRPVSKHADRAWAVMSENWQTSFIHIEPHNPFFQFFSRLVLHTWEVREAALRELNKPLPELPLIVANIKGKVSQMTPNTQHNFIQHQSNDMGMSMGDFSDPMPMDFAGHGFVYGMPAQEFSGSGPEGSPGVAVPSILPVNMNQSDWSTMIDWYPMHPSQPWQ